MHLFSLADKVFEQTTTLFEIDFLVLRHWVRTPDCSFKMYIVLNDKFSCIINSFLLCLLHVSIVFV